MNNNYNSKNNRDKSINNNDNDNNNITSLILANVFFTSCLNVFKLFLFTELGNLLQTEGPRYEKLFCPNGRFTKRNLKSSVIIS